MKYLQVAAVAVAAALLFVTPSTAQELTFVVPQELSDLRLPNGGTKTISTPTGWGSAFGSTFVGASFTKNAPYSEEADGGLAAGLGLWDPVLYVGVEGAVVLSDISEFNDVALSFKIHRYLTRSTTIAVGGENLFVDEDLSDIDIQSYFVVVSHTFQGFGRPGAGRLHASMGLGSGRFAKKSPRDAAEGKGEDGSIAFGSVALEIFRDANLVAEWSGSNLAAGIGITVPVGRVPFMATVAVADITDNSGDEPRLLVSGGFGLSIF